MSTEEREILRKLVNHPDGLVAPVDLINIIAERNNRAVQNLIVKGYIETAPATKLGNTYDFYRATEKGLVEFEPMPKKLWYHFKGDIRTVVVSVITAVLTSVAVFWIGLG